jgi:hypothetical protein
MQTRANTHVQTRQRQMLLSITFGRNNMYYDTIPCGQETISEKHSKTFLQCLWKCYGRQKQHWSLGEKCDSFPKVKVQLSDLPCSGRPVKAVSPEMLQSAKARISASQSDIWHLISQSTKEMLVTSFEIPDI